MYGVVFLFGMAMCDLNVVFHPAGQEPLKINSFFRSTGQFNRQVG